MKSAILAAVLLAGCASLPQGVEMSEDERKACEIEEPFDTDYLNSEPPMDSDFGCPITRPSDELVRESRPAKLEND